MKESYFLIIKKVCCLNTQKKWIDHTKLSIDHNNLFDVISKNEQFVGVSTHKKKNITHKKWD